jgi:hypothetical protein
MIEKAMGRYSCEKLLRSVEMSGPVIVVIPP